MDMENKEKETISKYFSSLGKKGGATNKKKGKAYFQWIRKQNKQRPVKAK
jgi:hypothetical protein